MRHKLKYFGKKTKPRISEFIWCPFCNCGYVSIKEKRPMVKCVYCMGSAIEARKATNEAKKIEDSLHNYTDEELKEFILEMGCGYYRAEFRTRLRKRYFGDQNEKLQGCNDE